MLLLAVLRAGDPVQVAVDNNSAKADSPSVRPAQKASAHASDQEAIQARAGGLTPSVLLLPVPAPIPVPRHVDVLPPGAAPDRAGVRRAQPELQRSAPARASCIPENDREQTPWWKQPVPARQPTSAPRFLRHPAKLSDRKSVV